MRVDSFKFDAHCEIIHRHHMRNHNPICNIVWLPQTHNRSWYSVANHIYKPYCGKNPTEYGLYIYIYIMSMQGLIIETWPVLPHPHLVSLASESADRIKHYQYTSDIRGISQDSPNSMWPRSVSLCTPTIAGAAHLAPSSWGPWWWVPSVAWWF